MKTPNTRCQTRFLVVLAGILMGTVSATGQFSPQSWNFGTGVGRDGDGGFPLLAVSGSLEGPMAEWSQTENAIRITASNTGSVYNDFSALLPMAGLGGDNLQDFVITLEGSLVSIPGDSWAYRGGIIALGDGALGTTYATTDHYAGILHRIQSSDRRVRMMSGVAGSVLVQTTPDTLSSGQAFTVRLEGSYDQDGALTMLLSAWYDNDTGTMWTVGPHTVTDPRDGSYFGIGGRIRANHAETPTVVDFHSLTIIPEPAAVAFAFGLLALVPVVFRRRFYK